MHEPSGDNEFYFETTIVLHYSIFKFFKFLSKFNSCSFLRKDTTEKYGLVPNVWDFNTAVLIAMCGHFWWVCGRYLPSYNICEWVPTQNVVTSKRDASNKSGIT